ncbi:hypothetical protein FUSNEC_GEN_287_01475 [Fusobacterium necrophorum subsp. funduliforme]|nr:hypothetical protein [Fusobacterium necrophorum]MDK4496656.1 hypothetical protein [Fusobacterium necrophorum]
MWKCKKCGSYHISEKVKGSGCNNTAKKYTFKSNIQEIADWRGGINENE